MLHDCSLTPASNLKVINQIQTLTQDFLGSLICFQTTLSFSFRGHSQLGQGWCYHGNQTRKKTK